MDTTVIVSIGALLIAACSLVVNFFNRRDVVGNNQLRPVVEHVQRVDLLASKAEALATTIKDRQYELEIRLLRDLANRPTDAQLEGALAKAMAPVAAHMVRHEDLMNEILRSGILKGTP